MSQIFFSEDNYISFLKLSSVPYVASLIMNLFIIIKVSVKFCHLFIFKRKEPEHLLQVVHVGEITCLLVNFSRAEVT